MLLDTVQLGGEAPRVDTPDDQRLVFLNLLPAGECSLHIAECHFRIQLTRIDSRDADEAVNRPKGRPVEVEGDTRKKCGDLRIEGEDELPIEFG